MNLSKTYFLLLLIFLSACKKLPRETHRGKGMMACYVNGVKWEAKNKLFTSPNLIGSPGGSTDPNPFAILYGANSSLNWLNATGAFLNIRGSSKKDDQGVITIYIRNFAGVGEYLLNDGHKISYAEYVPSIDGYSTDSINTGTINIKYFSDKVVAGTFSFNAVNQKGETIQITDGRFDIKYSTK